MSSSDSSGSESSSDDETFMAASSKERFVVQEYKEVHPGHDEAQVSESSNDEEESESENDLSSGDDDDDADVDSALAAATAALMADQDDDEQTFEQEIGDERVRYPDNKGWRDIYAYKDHPEGGMGYRCELCPKAALQSTQDVNLHVNGKKHKQQVKFSKETNKTVEDQYRIFKALLAKKRKKRVNWVQKKTKDMTEKEAEAYKLKDTQVHEKRIRNKSARALRKMMLKGKKIGLKIPQELSNELEALEGSIAGSTDNDKKKKKRVAINEEDEEVAAVPLSLKAAKNLVKQAELKREKAAKRALKNKASKANKQGTKRKATTSDEPPAKDTKKVTKYNSKKTKVQRLRGAKQ